MIERAAGEVGVDDVFLRLVRDALPEWCARAVDVEVAATWHGAGAAAVDGAGCTWPADGAPSDQGEDGAAATNSASGGGESRSDNGAFDWAVTGVTGGPSPDLPSPAVRHAQRAVAVLAGRPPTGRPADVSALLVLAQQVHGLALAELAEMEATGSHLSTGAATAATWLRDAQVLTDVSARATVRLATRLRDELPGLGALLRDGATTVEHCRAALAGVAGLDTRTVQESDAAVCDLVRTTDPASVRALLRERAEAVSPELGRDAERRAHARRGFTVDALPTGGVLGGALGVEDTAAVLLGLDLAVRADRTDGDQRSLRQRRADVLVAWARREIAVRGGDAVREDLRSARAQVHVTCTLDQLSAAVALLTTGAAGEATGGWWAGASSPPDLRQTSRVPAGGSLGPGLLVSRPALRRLLCDASMALHVQADGAAGGPPDLRAAAPTDPLSVGRAAPFVTAAQWRALVVRDRHCVVTGCRRPPLQCEAHHVRHWLDGGATDLPNVVLLCFQHHHEHHDRGHDLRHRDGRWITSTGWGAQGPPSGLGREPAPSLQTHVPRAQQPGPW